MKVLVVVLAICSLPVTASDHKSLAKLQATLDGALEDDEAINLVASTDFLSPPGSVIFTSRAEGSRRMVALARSGEPELSMLFLPRWKAWITDTTVRMRDRARIDTRYATAALVLDMEAELWHTHNNVGDELADDHKLFKQSLRWTMPSSDDLLQLYEFKRDIPGARLRGVIASIYGLTMYGGPDDPSWAQALYVRFALRTEAEKLHDEAGELSVKKLSGYARAHDGFMRLEFKRMR